MELEEGLPTGIDNTYQEKIYHEKWKLLSTQARAMRIRRSQKMQPEMSYIEKQDTDTQCKRWQYCEIFHSWKPKIEAYIVSYNDHETERERERESTWPAFYHRKHSPEVANNLCLIHVSTPNSKSSIRINAATRCVEKWRKPIITFLFRETFEGTKVMAATNRKKAPAEDTYECPSI